MHFYVVTRDVATNSEIISRELDLEPEIIQMEDKTMRQT